MVATWREKLLQMDLLGVAIVMGIVVSYMLALQYGGQSMPWRSATVVGLLVTSAVLLVVFIFWENYQGDRAMIPPRLFKQRKIAVASMFTIFLDGAYFVPIYVLPLYFQVSTH